MRGASEDSSDNGASSLSERLFGADGWTQVEPEADLDEEAAPDGKRWREA